ncbi:FKBP-type peptidyl-prolyl cis-trans isomerase [Embleya sp. NBC_00888]|uniref:FKBP-type peptidyl-prolyl cis-trans isomerase n=1 Tax=Embleya sp. NBC_00888 TaxID=2975960 RepID=UPI003866BDA0|nr:FKBP-type peptidyl-prolyl cis-trans isomerase [Embleya sp. NBC_00888]
MRRLAALLLVPALAFTAVACGDDDGGKTVTPIVTGAFGQKPDIKIPKGKSGDKTTSKILIEGTGDVIKKDDYVVADTVGKNWDGTDAGNSYDTKTPEVFQAGSQELLKEIGQGIIGKKTGTRMLVVVPAKVTQEKQAVVLMLDLKSTKTIDPKTEAKGAAVTPPAGLPVAKVESGKAAEITIPPGATAPTKLTVQPLIEGTGPVVQKGQTLVAQYTGALFDKGTKFDSSWDHGGATAFKIGVGQVVTGWDEGLVGQKVGSRVLLVLPPDKGYGAEGSGEKIPPNSPLVFVVDIIDALGGTAA